MRKRPFLALGLVLGAVTELPASAQPADSDDVLHRSELAERTRKKLRIVRLSVALENKTLEEALDHLRQAAKQQDSTEPDPDRRGVNLVVRKEQVGRRIVSRLASDRQPLGEVLAKLAKITGTKFILTDYGLLFDDLTGKPPKPPSLMDATSQEQREITSKLSHMVIPVVDLDQNSLVEAMDFIRSRSIELDIRELQPDKKGIAFAEPEKAIAKRQIHCLKLRNVTPHAACQAIATLADLQYQVAEGTVRFVPTGDDE